jgi:5-methylcytosine-specific restriction endonuclease McrA
MTTTGMILTRRGATKVCPQCERPFYRAPSYGEQITCSRTCRARYMQDKGEEVACLHCRTLFWRRLSSAKLGYGNFCSRPCYFAFRRAPGRNQAWKASQRRDWKDTKCAQCGATRRLQLDHIIPTWLGGQNVRENAQTLCKACNILKFHRQDKPAPLRQSYATRS